nr:hypothetical protein CFP56_19383 [Quercus suber]
MTPATPDRSTPHRLTTMNRSFTLPTKMTSPNVLPPTAGIGAADGIETLYTVPKASIIKFSTAGFRPSSAPGSSRDAAGAQSSGTLPWASPTERTMAAGPLEIYRVPGSVSFLHSGALLHAIMPRSQCWCVDGVSKFAFRVLPDTYYRIELAGQTPEDLELVEALKETLKKVLFYERTPCPFARTFSVDLPDPAPEVRKSRRRHTGPAKKWKLARAYSWKPEDGSGSDRRGSEDGSTSEGNLSSEDETDTAEVEGEQDGDLSDQEEQADEVGELGLRTPTRPARFQSKRSVTAPPQLALQGTPPSRVKISEAFDGTIKATERLEQGARSPLHPDRLRTFQAIPTVMPPSPPDSSAGVENAAEASVARIETLTASPYTQFEEAKRDEELVVEALSIIDNVVSSEPRPDDEDVSVIVTNSEAELGKTFVHTSEAVHTTQSGLFTASPVAQSPDLPSQQIPNQDARRPSLQRQGSSSEDPFAAIQARILARRNISGATLSLPPHRTFSSTSSSSTGSSSRSGVSRRSHSAQRAQQQQAAFATALVRKACSVFLGPPAHLVAIMLRIAARFANGAFSTNFATALAGIEPSWSIPGSFHLESATEPESVTDEDMDDALEEWEDGAEEDDFGVPLTSPVRLRSSHADLLRERKRSALALANSRRDFRYRKATTYGDPCFYEAYLFVAKTA